MTGVPSGCSYSGFAVASQTLSLSRHATNRRPFFSSAFTACQKRNLISKNLLWGNNSACSVTAGQKNAAMIDHLRWNRFLWSLIGEWGPLDNRSAAGRAPIRKVAFFQHGMALAANSFHSSKITGSGRQKLPQILRAHPPERSLKPDPPPSGRYSETRVTLF